MLYIITLKCLNNTRNSDFNKLNDNEVPVKMKRNMFITFGGNQANPNSANALNVRDASMKCLETDLFKKSMLESPMLEWLICFKASWPFFSLSLSLSLFFFFSSTLTYLNISSTLQCLICKQFQGSKALFPQSHEIMITNKYIESETTSNFALKQLHFFQEICLMYIHIGTYLSVHYSSSSELTILKKTFQH